MDAPVLYGIDPNCLYPWTDEAFLDENGKPKHGAPVVLLKPLREASVRALDAARNKHQQLRAKVLRKATEKTVRQEGETDEAYDARWRVAFDEEAVGLVDALDDIYHEDLKVSILKECIAGWENLRTAQGPIKFSNVPEVDYLVIPRDWRPKIFWAIVNESAWDADAREGFGARQG